MSNMVTQPALGFSHYLVGVLHVPKRSMLAYAVHVSTAFFLSSLGHIVSAFPIHEGKIEMSEVCQDVFLFFMSQAVTIITESIVIKTFRMLSTKSPGKKGTEGEQGQSTCMSMTALVGYTWVILWLALSGWWFVRLYVRLWMIPEM
jgi:hypothetical protein